MSTNETIYDVAISFSEQDRDVALCISLALELAEVKSCFYYPDHREETVGRSLAKRLHDIFYSKTRAAVVIISKAYFERPDAYTLVELAAILARISMEPDAVFMIPVVIDESSLYGYDGLNRFGWIKWEHKPKDVGQILKNILGKKAGQRNNLSDMQGRRIYIQSNQIVTNEGPVFNQLIIQNTHVRS